MQIGTQKDKNFHGKSSSFPFFAFIKQEYSSIFEIRNSNELFIASLYVRYLVHWTNFRLGGAECYRAS